MADSEAMESRTIELPDLVKHHILSFLSIRGATKTSVLSKSWLSAWRTRPTLEFNYDLFFAKELHEESYSWWDQEKRTERCTKFFECITSNLEKHRQQNVSIETFKLKLQQTYDWYDLVEKCMKVVMKSGVRNLNLSMLSCRLPQFVLGTKSLIDLSLSNCSITQESVGEIRCHGLKRLSLSLVSFDELTFENMIKSCQLIETLEIYYGFELEKFRLTNLPKLKRLIIILGRDQTVEVEAPSLELLELVTVTDMDYLFSKEEVNCWITLRGFRPYQNLKCLLLGAIGINDNFFVNLADKFPNLESLFVRHCHGLKRIKISSHSIKSIQLMDNRNLVEAQFNVPNMVLFEYLSDWDIIPQLYFATASSGWVSNINIGWMRGLNSTFFLALMKLLASLIQSKISLRVEFDFSYDVAFNLDDVRDSVTVREPQEVQELSVFSNNKNFYSSKASLALDGIFWVCRPKIIKQHWNSRYPKNEATKYLYEMLMFRKIEDRVHNLHQTRDWQHDLKEVKFEMFNGALGRGDRIMFMKAGEKEKLHEDLDWQNFLNISENDSYFERMICFKVEWRREGKRLE